MSDPAERKAAIERIKKGDATREDYWIVIGNMTDEEYRDKELERLIDGFISALESDE